MRAQPNAPWLRAFAAAAASRLHVMHDARLDALLAAYLELLPESGVVHAAAAALPGDIMMARAARAAQRDGGEEEEARTDEDEE